MKFLKKIKKIKAIPTILLLGLIILAASWSLSQTGLFYVHDFIHAARIAEMFRGLTEGQLPVRWSDNFGYGYGMPLFQFYAPLPYFFAALLMFLNLPVSFIIKTIFFVPTVLSAIGGYLLAKEVFKSRLAAIVSSAAFTLASYRAVNLFVRGAVSEAWAMAIFPFILYYGLKLVKDNRAYWPHLTLSLTALLLTHNISALLFIPLSGLLLLGFHYYHYNRHKVGWLKILLQANFLLIVGSYLYSLVLSAFYWLPAILEKNFTIVDEAIVSGYFDYHLHFLYIRQFFDPTFAYGGSVWGPEDDLSFFLGWGQWLALGLLVLFVGRLIWQKRNKWRSLLTKQVLIYTSIFGLAAAATLYMSLLKSQPIWEALPFMAFVQFPWRWLAVTTLFISLLTGAAVYFSPNHLWRWLIATIVLVVILLTSTGYFQPDQFLQDDNSLYYFDAERIRSHMSDILPDYLPTNFNRELPVANMAYLEDPNYQAELQLNQAHQKAAVVEVAEPSLFTFTIADYPGWTTYLNGDRQEKRVTDDGLVALEVPAGNHRVAAQLQPTLTRQLADLTSALGILAFMLLIIYAHQNQNVS